ncbi:hypothetical protein [Sphaerisporangium sp. TRM90804]|uniref:hypothetical protein n=1 Tax=Sphaerisporangium sp. TRM90804 TaxID=3031113 RepID=UPI00244C9D82|nr:hypothetical protein [Sphaerisporangium sp. TRM90804]MDH2424709.1 hypothetical protein [Sphaerisporangium sp. TRM90804]
MIQHMEPQESRSPRRLRMPRLRRPRPFKNDALTPPHPTPEASTRLAKPSSRITIKQVSRTGWDTAAVIALAVGVLVIVAVGLRVGMGALEDSALAAHIDAEAAGLYWIGVDGLIVVAIIAALVLRNVPGARRYCLGVVAFFTTASGLLQYLHGLGWFTPDRVTGSVRPLPWGVVLVIALLVIGTIFCGTHLFVHVLRHMFPGSPPEQAVQSITTPTTEHPADSGKDLDDHHPKGGPADSDTEREVRKWFAAVAVGLLIDAGAKPVRKRLAQEFGIAERQAGYVIADVIREREEAAERVAKQAAITTQPPTVPVVSSAKVPAEVGPVNGSAPSRP